MSSTAADDKPPAKKSKTSPTIQEPPSSLIVGFKSQDGEEKSTPSVDLPVDTSSKQLELLINSLLGNEDSLPYAFYINDVEVVGSVKETLDQLAELGQQQSYEDILSITYHPLSVFRVRPVTRCIETMPGHTDAVLHISYSPDGKQLASGGGDMAVRFWNVTTCLPQYTCTGHRHHVLCTTWSPDGLLFVSADRSGEIRVWDSKTGTQKGQPLIGHKKWVTSLSFEPLHADPRCMRLASSSKDHTIKIWNVKTGQCEVTISGHTDSVECVKWGGTGLLYTCSRDRTIKVWEVDGSGRNQHKLIRTLTGHAHRINTLALNCDYALRTGAFQLGESVAIAGKGAGSASAADGVLQITPEEIQEKARERYNTVVGAEGERLVSGSDDFTLFMWKPQEDKKPLTRMTGHQQAVNHIAFSPDGRFVASASFDKKVKLWCGRTGRFLATFNGHVGSVYQVAWSADSHYLVSASKDSTVKLWSVKDTKKALYTLPGHEDEVYALDWSPSGAQVASGSKDRTIKIWHH